jgi:alkylation response protein AidB-like acyl-CoA dehydrogenase
VSRISARPREPGRLYAFPAFGLLAVGVASVALGIGRRALEEIRELAVRKTPALATRRLAERPATQARVAEAEATLGSARAYLLHSVREVWEEAAAGGILGTGSRARVRLVASWAVRAATRAVDRAYELGGASAIHRSSPLQRLFRDVHAVSAHAMVADPTFELVGRVLLGVDVDTSML